jgi:hypothetical protein
MAFSKPLAVEARECEVVDVERLDAPSPLPAPDSFMDTLDPIYRSLPTYYSLDEHLRGELRILLAKEARRSRRTWQPVAQLRPTWRSPAALVVQ